MDKTEAISQLSDQIEELIKVTRWLFEDLNRRMTLMELVHKESMIRAGGDRFTAEISKWLEGIDKDPEP